MPNLYGEIVSDLAAGLVGGLGLTPTYMRTYMLEFYLPIAGSCFYVYFIKMPCQR